MLESVFRASDMPHLNEPVNATFPDGLPVWVLVPRLDGEPGMIGFLRLRAVVDALVAYGFARFTLLEEPPPEADILGPDGSTPGPLLGVPLIAPATQIAMVDAVTLLGEVLGG